MATSPARPRKTATKKIATKRTLPKFNDCVQKINAVRLDMNKKFFERNEVIDGILTGLISCEHGVILGPYGSAKTHLLEDAALRTGKRFFGHQLDEQTKLEELFGMLNVSKLAPLDGSDSIYEYNAAGMFPEAQVAFLDEIGNINSSTGHRLLKMINERRWRNGGAELDLPLESLWSGTTHLFDDKDTMAPFWDRFLLRFNIGYVQEDGKWLAMIMAGEELDEAGPNAAFPAKMTNLELTALQTAVSKIQVTNDAADSILTVKKKLAEENIVISDRRWRKCIKKISRAYAILNGATAVESEHLECLQWCLWEDPQQISTIRRIVSVVANPSSQLVIEIMDQARDVFDNAIKSFEDTSVADASSRQLGLEATGKFQKFTKRLNEISKKHKNVNKARLQEVREALDDWNSQVLSRSLGLDVSDLEDI